MQGNLQNALDKATSLQGRLRQWLSAHDEHPAPPQRQCLLASLRLAAPSPIVKRISEAGASPASARAISDYYLLAAKRLQETITSEFEGALRDVQPLHTDCPHMDAAGALLPCALSRRIKDSFCLAYEQKLQALVRDATELVSQHAATLKSATAKKFPPPLDYAPILEFAFTQSTKPNAKEKALLAQVTGLTLKQVSVWFQNRRTRSKAGAGTRSRPPQTLDELGARLREQQRLKKDFRQRQKNEDSDNDSHDSGYASASSPPTVKDITNMLRAFHIDEDAEEMPRPKPKVPRKTGPKRATGLGDENAEARADTQRRFAGKATRVRQVAEPEPSSSTQATPPRRAGGRAPARTARRTTAQSSTQFANSMTTDLAELTSPPSHDIPAAVATNEAEATSSNKATRSRKKAALPARRPKASRSTRGVQVASSSSSGSSVPSLSPSSSRSSSLSTDGFPDIFSSPAAFSAPLPQTEPVYYTKNASGEFVPVTTPIVVRPQIVVPPPVHIGYPDLSLDFSSLFDHPSIGPVGPHMVAPDSDPRAFSSNILGSTMEPVITTEDFSALLELLSENTGDASTSGTSALDLTSAMSPVQGPPLNAGHDASSIAPIPDPTSLTVSDYDFGSVVWPEFDETSWSQLLGLA